MIHKPSNQLEADLAAKDVLILRAAEATHHLASVLSNVHHAFWSVPTERLLAVLNADIPATLETFAANTALAQACNASLNALDLPEMSTRAPVEPGRTDIVFDGGQFVLAADPPNS
jgi:hypothetical protein